VPTLRPIGRLHCHPYKRLLPTYWLTLTTAQELVQLAAILARLALLSVLRASRPCSTGVSNERVHLMPAESSKLKCFRPTRRLNHLAYLGYSRLCELRAQPVSLISILICFFLLWELGAWRSCLRSRHNSFVLVSWELGSSASELSFAHQELSIIIRLQIRTKTPPCISCSYDHHSSSAFAVHHNGS
jgi:hypothetical protein